MWDATVTSSCMPCQASSLPPLPMKILHYCPHVQPSCAIAFMNFAQSTLSVARTRVLLRYSNTVVLHMNGVVSSAIGMRCIYTCALVMYNDMACTWTRYDEHHSQSCRNSTVPHKISGLGAGVTHTIYDHSFRSQRWARFHSSMIVKCILHLVLNWLKVASLIFWCFVNRSLSCSTIWTRFRFWTLWSRQESPRYAKFAKTNMITVFKLISVERWFHCKLVHKPDSTGVGKRDLTAGHLVL